MPIDQLRWALDGQARTIAQVWLVVSMALVFLMQAGFLLLEAGATRSKNAINVAQKNLVDFALAGLLFYLVGFSVMFGPSFGGFIGSWNGAPHPTASENLNGFLFQLMFCGTAATIVSGAVAERMTFRGYLILTAMISAIIYPIFGHWAWGSAFIEANPALLAKQGFIDFAGGTVVHSVGGWVALAAIMVIGPRKGKFDSDGRPRKMVGHSAVLSALGCLLLWIGWIGFNGGSVSPDSELLGPVLANTMIAGLTGGVAACFAGFFLDGHFRPDRLINGILAGLVGITAGAFLFGIWQSFLIGTICGLLVMAAVWFIECKLRLDDVVGAVAVHGVCGAAGTIFVGIFGNADALAAGSRFGQIMIQVQGVAIAAVWSFGASYGALRLLDKYVGLRVSAEDEEKGLNVAEHGWSLGSGRLLETLAGWNEEGQPTTGGRISDLDGDEAGELGREINRIMAARDRREHELLFDAVHDPLTSLLNRHGLGGMAANAMRRIDQKGTRFAVIGLDLDGFKPINDAHGHAVGDEILIQVAARMNQCLRSSDTIARTGGDEFVILVQLDELENDFADQLAWRIINKVAQPFSTGELEIHIGASAGVCIVPDEERTIDEAMLKADERLYHSKRLGRRRVTSARPSVEQSKIPT